MSKVLEALAVVVLGLLLIWGMSQNDVFMGWAALGAELKMVIIVGLIAAMVFALLRAFKAS